jgi:hypothetical protein
MKSSFIRIAEAVVLHRKQNILKQEWIKTQINCIWPIIVLYSVRYMLVGNKWKRVETLDILATKIFYNLLLCIQEKYQWMYNA